MKVREQLREAVLVFSSCGFRHVDSRDQTKVFGLGSIFTHLAISAALSLLFIKFLPFFLGELISIVLADCWNLAITSVMSL